METGLTCVTNAGAAGGTPATPVTDVIDESYEMSRGTADTSSRASAGWKDREPAIFDGSAEISMVWNSSDAGQSLIKAAWSGRTLIALGFENAAGYGVRADYAVESFNFEQPLKDGQTVSASFKQAGAATLLTPA